MQVMLAVLAVWGAYVTGVHVVGGARRVVAPLQRSDVEPFARGVLLVVWHMVTWALALLTGAVALAAFAPRYGDLVVLGGLQAGGFAVVFLVVAKRELGAAIRLPQWLLLGPLAVGLLATLTARPAAIAAGLLVLLLAAAHVAWASGTPWPARDGLQLAAHVLPPSGRRRGAKLPSRALTLLVAAVLGAMSACLLVPQLGGWAATVMRYAVLAVSAVFAARGVGGLVYGAARREAGAAAGGTRSPFFVYDRLMYSPGCLLIAALAAVSTTGVR
ncbi:MAG: hypothetical protein JWP97_4570 [Labilithrix sp.]|nr:hypothetical protein [Labilithrix sp.]